MKEVAPKATIGKKISASKDYMKSESVREMLQNIVTSKVVSGEITDQKQLDRWFNDAMMSLQTLKMIPLEVYKKQPKI